jgi:hypothetical protein
VNVRVTESPRAVFSACASPMASTAGLPASTVANASRADGKVRHSALPQRASEDGSAERAGATDAAGTAEAAGFAPPPSAPRHAGTAVMRPPNTASNALERSILRTDYRTELAKRAAVTQSNAAHRCSSRSRSEPALSGGGGAVREAKPRGAKAPLVGRDKTDTPSDATGPRTLSAVAVVGDPFL